MYFRIISLIAFLLGGVGCASLSLHPTTFRSPKKLLENKEWRNYPVLFDLNGDKLLDIIATHRRPLYENSLHLWLSNEDGGLKEVPQTWASPGYSGLGVGDFNRDGKTDIVAGSHFNRFHTYTGTSLGNFENVVTPTIDGYVAARLIDLDGDGNQEMVMLGNERAGVEIYSRQNDSWSLRTSLLAGNIGRDMQIVDMNRDGRLDIVVSMPKIGVALFTQSENGKWKQAPDTNFFSATKEFKSMAIADLNKDGWPDIALNGGRADSGKLNGPDVFLSKGESGEWQASSGNLKMFSKPADGVAIADFNSDGNLDLVVGGNKSKTVLGATFGLFLFLGDGQGNWKLEENSGLPDDGMVRPYGFASGDLNGDGHPDLVALHSDPEGDSGYILTALSK